MAYLQHIEHERILRLAEQISAGPGQVVSKTLVQNGAVGITLFAFSEGSQISAHSASGDAMVTVLEGRGLLTVNGQRRCVRALQNAADGDLSLGGQGPVASAPELTLAFNSQAEYPAFDGKAYALASYGACRALIQGRPFAAAAYARHPGQPWME